MQGENNKEEYIFVTQWQEIHNTRKEELNENNATSEYFKLVIGFYRFYVSKLYQHPRTLQYTYPLPKETSDFVDCFLDLLVATQGYRCH